MHCTPRLNHRTTAFIIYFNDLFLNTSLLYSFMFSDDTNLFYSHQYIKVYGKLSLNEKKRQIGINRDDIPLKLQLFFCRDKRKK